MEKRKKSFYEYEVEKNSVTIYRNGKRCLSVPASASVNGVLSGVTLLKTDGDKAVFAAQNEEMLFEFYNDCIVATYRITYDEDTPIFEAKMLKAADSAIDLEGFDRAFTSQPRNNNWDNMDYFNHLPDISMYGYFTPPAFQFSIGNKDGWVSFGLLDIPDTFVCKMDDDYSFLVESCGGNKVIKRGGTYQIPRVIITFPDDEFSAVSLFRQKLIDFGCYTPKKPKFSTLPSWWKHPFVCTYGDQMLEHKVGAVIDEKWVRELVDIAQTQWGLEKINLIIDDSWQHYFSFEPKAEESRFPDMRAFIDSMHERGHHVILWNTPLFDNLDNGFETRAQRFGMVTDYRYATLSPNGYFATVAPECYAIDYTSDHARQFLREVCRQLFGSGEGEYNADGVKLDFIGRLRDPAKTNSYAHPERGIGVTELLRFYEIFYEEAKNVKPDVLIDCTVGDPRFEHCIDFNRMHDTHCGTMEKEIRADLSSRACPDLLIDSDGALMFTSWLKTHYISAAIYGIPSIYYLKNFHDFATDEEGRSLYRHDEKSKLLPREKKQLGALLSLCSRRPDGTPEFEQSSAAFLKDKDKINGLTRKGETVIYYPTVPKGTGYLFTWQDETIILPLHGRKFSNLQPAEGVKHILVDYARDRVILHVEPGIIYTFQDIDDNTSIERPFIEKRGNVPVETDISYVNGT